MTCGAIDYLLKDENILRTLSISVDKVLEKHQLKKSNQKLLQDLAAKNKELEKSNKQLLKLNEIKNKFLGMAAHDLRSPLASIRGLSEFLLNEIFGSLTEEQKEYIKNSSGYRQSGQQCRRIFATWVCHIHTCVCG